MTLEDIDIIYDKLKPHSGRLSLSCAFEPLIHKDIVKIIEKTTELPNWAIRINTNGILLNKEISRAICESNIDEIVVSLDGSNTEENFAIRQHDHFDQIVSSLTEFCEMREVIQKDKKKTLTCVRSTALLDNLESLPRMVELTSKIGADRFIVKHVVPIAGTEYKGKPMETQSCLLDPEKSNEFFEKAVARGKKIGISVLTPPAYPKPESELQYKCAQATGGFHVYPDGNCYPCPWLTGEDPTINMLEPDVTPEKVREFLENQKVISSFTKGEPVDKCLDCLRDMQTIGLKATDDAELRMSEKGEQK